MDRKTDICGTTVYGLKLFADFLRQLVPDIRGECNWLVSCLANSSWNFD